MDDIFYKKKLKYSSLKKIIKNDASLISIGTVDSLHTKYINNFIKQNKNLVKYEDKINNLELEIKKLDNKYSIDDLITKVSKIEELEKYIDLKKKISNYEDELDYFSKSLDILENYYTIDKSSNDDNIVLQSSDNLNTLFKTYKKELDETILEEYLKCTSNKINKPKSNILSRNCPLCTVEKVLQPSDGNLVCIECGHVDQIVVDMEKINFKDPFYENKNSGYKRMNHFSELMNQFQAKETTDINNSIYKMIITELKKQKIIDPVILKKKKLREILKKLELNQYFEHIPFIINKLTGLPPPTMSRATEELIKTMFKKIQEPFEMYRPKCRKNFLNYNYVFHKFFELLELDQFLLHFPLLKSLNKLREQDEIWENICKHLKWQYIPSQ